MKSEPLFKKGTYRYPYVTVEELKRNPDLLEVRRDDKGGARFVGPTDIELGLKYLPKDEPVLECGPMFGKFLKVLQDEGYKKVHGLDFVDMLYFPDRKNLTFNLVDFNCETFPYQDNYFSGIAAWGFGEHLENPFHFIREAHRVLKPGGMLLFSLPNIFHITSRLFFLKDGMFPRWHYDNNHIAMFPHGVFEKTILRYFDVVEVVYRKPSVKMPPYFFWKLINRWLPSNQYFGNFVHYVLKKKEFEPFS